MPKLHGDAAPISAAVNDNECAICLEPFDPLPPGCCPPPAAPTSLKFCAPEDYARLELRKCSPYAVQIIFRVRDSSLSKAVFSSFPYKIPSSATVIPGVG